ncbi:MAG: hypothetical protein WB540_11675, partial [Pseudolabrys sp.]
STWLLEWVFAEPATSGKKVACCDACCRRVIKRLGEIGYVQVVLGATKSPGASTRDLKREEDDDRRVEEIARQLEEIEQDRLH